MYGSIDLVTDKIERQIRKNKTKIERKNRNKVSTSQLFTDALVEDSDVAQAKVVRSKQIDLKPMDLKKHFFRWTYWAMISSFISMLKMKQQMLFIDAKMEILVFLK